MADEKFSTDIGQSIKKQFADQIRSFKGHTSKKMTILADMMDFVNEKAEVERKAAEQLLKVCNKPRNSNAFDDSRDSSSGAGHVTDVWAALVSQTKQTAEVRLEAAEALLDKTRQSLQDIRTETEMNSKKCVDWALAMQAEVAETYKDVDAKYKEYNRDQGGYAKASSRLQKSQAKGGRSANKKEINLKNDLDKSERKATMARNEFLLSLASANAIRKRYFEIELGDLFDALDFEYHDALRYTYRAFHDTTVEAAKGTIAASDGLWQVASVIDKATEKDHFFKRYSSAMAVAPELQFVASNDDTVAHIKLDLESEAVPRFRLLEQMLVSAESEIRAEQQKLNTLCNAPLDGKAGALIGADDTAEPIVLALTAIAMAHSKAAIRRSNTLAQLRSIDFSFAGGDPNKYTIKLSAGTKLDGVADDTKWIKPPTGRFPELEIEPVEEDADGQRILRIVSPKPGEKSKNFLGSQSTSSLARATPACFGSNLIEYCKSTGDSIPLIVRSCLKFVGSADNMAQEGVFRLSGGKGEVDGLKDSFDKGIDPLQDLSVLHDVNAVAGCLKLYFRQLDDPILTKKLYPAWVKVAQIANSEHRIVAIREIMQHHLPQEHTRILSVLLPFLKRISSYAAENKMPIPNIAVVFGPTLLPAPANDNAAMLRDGSSICQLVGFMIENHAAVFQTGAADSPERDEKSTTVVCQAKAVFNYTARNAEEISFMANDIIDIYEKIDDNWWDGDLGGQRGFIAAAYVEEWSTPADELTKTIPVAAMESGDSDDSDPEGDYLQIDIVPPAATPAPRPETMFAPKAAEKPEPAAATRSMTMGATGGKPMAPERKKPPERTKRPPQPAAKPAAAPKPSSRPGSQVDLKLPPMAGAMVPPERKASLTSISSSTSEPSLTESSPISSMQSLPRAAADDADDEPPPPPPPSKGRPTPFVKPKPKPKAGPGIPPKPKPKPSPGIPRKPAANPPEENIYGNVASAAPAAPPGGRPKAPVRDRGDSNAKLLPPRPSPYTAPAVEEPSVDGPPSGPPEDEPLGPPPGGPPPGLPADEPPLREAAPGRPPPAPPMDDEHPARFPPPVPSFDGAPPDVPPFDAPPPDVPPAVPPFDAPPPGRPPSGPPSDEPLPTVISPAAASPDSLSGLPPPLSADFLISPEDAAFDALEDEDAFDPTPIAAPPPPPPEDYGSPPAMPPVPIVVEEDGPPGPPVMRRPSAGPPVGLKPGGLILTQGLTPRTSPNRQSVGPSFAPPAPPPDSPA